LLIVSLIREGIPYSFFNLIKEVSPFSELFWADLLEISTKSLHRYKKSLKHFKLSHSEKIIEMAEVTQLGLEVFGNMDKFKLWLETPNYALGNLAPLELLKDSYGKEMVTGELTRINYGILA
jgi:putative toxin-antitoxin system antitoxin component (TIGR02293 family)